MKHIILATALLFTSTLTAQSTYTEEVAAAQEKLNEQYRDSAYSPLDSADFATFTEHEFFPIDSTFCVTARIKRTPFSKPFMMTTTKGAPREYRKWGEAHFTINGEKHVLNLYQSTSLKKKSGYADYLFLPFRDATNSVDSYGGGRFLNLRIPEKGKKITIDFNLAYNPYCAYSARYSCPVTPEENTLPIRIEAGIKGPTTH